MEACHTEMVFDVINFEINQMACDVEVHGVSLTPLPSMEEETSCS